MQRARLDALGPAFAQAAQVTIGGAELVFSSISLRAVGTSDANNFAHPPNRIRNEINTRVKLKDYDPQLYDATFRGLDWRPPCFR